MILRIFGDIFESDCEYIVNPTNSVGVMGAGLAFVFKNKFPKMCAHFNDYSLSYQMNRKSLALMHPYFYPANLMDNTRGVLMFPTKIHWKYDSKYEYIETNLKHTRRMIDEMKNRAAPPTIAFPLIGAGHGGLDAEKIIGMITDNFSDYGSKIEIYTT